MLEGVDCFRDHLVLFEREDGLPQVRVTDLRTGAAHRIAFPEAGLHRLAGGEPRVRHPHVPLQLPVARHAAVRLRLRHGDAERRRSSRSSRCSAATTGRSTRPSASSRPPRTASQVPISIVYRKGLVEGRHRPAVPLRLRLLRLPAARHLLVEPREPARPRRRLRHRARPRRRRDGQGLARRRPHDARSEHVHRLHRRRRVPARREVRQPRPARRSRAAARAGC